MPALEQPTGTLLAAGGDTRLLLDPVTGLNRYGCSTRPDPGVTALGSCTASTVSPVGFGAASRERRRLLAVGAGEWLLAAVEERYRELRETLTFALVGHLVPDLDVVICPSGTDAELLALALAHGDRSRPLTNVVVGPTEVGSGTVQAAQGLHFDALTPSGIERVPGEPVDASLTDRTRTDTVWLRDEAGSSRGEDDVDAEVESLVEEQIGLGRRVLLHIVAHSKTGVHAPSLARVATLRERHGEQLAVLVDAAQGRFSRRGLVEVLRRGYLVLVTGSKFYGGPPFAGALLVPASAHPRRRGMTGLGAGFADYFTGAQLPDSWGGARAALGPPGNPGLLLRWAGAAAEMHDYYATPSRLRLQVLRAFEQRVPEILGSSDAVSFEHVFQPVYDDETERLLESKTTVFPFTLLSHGESLGREALGRVYHWLNADVSALAPRGATTEERRALAPRIHVGQPVDLGREARPGPAILRVALGTVLLVRVAQDPECGATFADRVHWLEDRLITLKRKLEVIAQHYPGLVEASDRAARMDAGER